jgi:sec-independent protein translocase protein TatB
MLPGVGFSELLVIGVIALLVVGPKDLPLMLRKLGRQMAKFRALANEFRTGIDELARQAELDELKKEVEALRRGQMFSDIEAETMRPFTHTQQTGAFGDPSPPIPPEEIPPIEDPKPDEPIEPEPDLPEPMQAALVQAEPVAAKVAS